ncbi:MAG: hypothetical protein IPK13_17410 [Deltaproteobacteria bacterium]|nr:hypothetical protein [Deltaproteobacteria bacterium]
MVARETASVFVRIVGWIGQFLRGRPGQTTRSPVAGRIQAPPTLVARIARVAGRDREMLRLADEAIRRGHPEQAVIACWKAARSFIKDGHMLKAVAVLNRILRYEVRDVDAWLELAMCYEALERRREAANACVRAAELLELRGDDADAMMMLEKGLDLDPARGDAEARLIPLRGRLGVSRVVPSPSRAPSTSLDVEGSADDAPIGIASLGQASSLHGFRDDDSGSIELPDLEDEWRGGLQSHSHSALSNSAQSNSAQSNSALSNSPTHSKSPSWSGYAAVHRAFVDDRPDQIRDELPLFIASDGSDATDPGGAAVELADGDEALATDATVPLRLPVEADDPTVMNLPVPDVVAQRARDRVTPAVLADATVAERIPASLLGVPGVAATTIEPVPRRPRIVDAATTVDARALPSSIRGSEHEGRARREAAVRATDAATRAYPRVADLDSDESAQDDWELGFSE